MRPQVGENGVKDTKEEEDLRTDVRYILCYRCSSADWRSLHSLLQMFICGLAFATFSVTDVHLRTGVRYILCYRCLSAVWRSRRSPSIVVCLRIVSSSPSSFSSQPSPSSSSSARHFQGSPTSHISSVYHLFIYYSFVYI